MVFVLGINRYRLQKNRQIIDVLVWFSIIKLLPSYDEVKRNITSVKSRITRQNNKLKELKGSQDCLDDEIDYSEIYEIESKIEDLRKDLDEYESRLKLIEEEILNRDYVMYTNYSIQEEEHKISKIAYCRQFQQELRENLDPILGAASVLNRFSQRYYGIGNVEKTEYKFTKVTELKKMIKSNFTEEDKYYIESIGNRLIEHQGRDLCDIEKSRSMVHDKNKIPSDINELLCEYYIDFYLKKLRLSRHYDSRSQGLIKNCMFLGRRQVDIDREILIDYINTGYSLLYVKNLGGYQYRCKMIYQRIIKYVDLLLLEENAKFYGLQSKPPMNTFLHKYDYDGFFHSLTYLRKNITKEREELIKYINMMSNVIKVLQEESPEVMDYQPEYQDSPRPDYRSGDDDDMDFQQALIASMSQPQENHIDI